MLKVLVADKNFKANLNCCQFLANDKSLDVKSANSGIEVLNTYHEIRPDVLVINSNFEDKNFYEIINEISSTSEERNNSNIILTTDDANMLFKTKYVAKIYKLLKYPIDNQKIKNSIEQYNLDKFIFFEPSNENLISLFYKLNLYNDLKGASYFRFAIQECYNNPKLLNSLNDIYAEVASEFNASYSSIRPAMRNVLKSVNDYRNKKGNTGIFKLFENEDNITPRNFIRIITTHYLKQKNKK